MFVLPVTQVSTAFLQHLPIPESVLSSVEHHVLLGKQVQIIFVLYVTLLLCLVHYMQYSKSRVQTIASAAIIGLLLIALLLIGCANLQTETAASPEPTVLPSEYSDVKNLAWLAVADPTAFAKASSGGRLAWVRFRAA